MNSYLESLNSILSNIKDNLGKFESFTEPSDLKSSKTKLDSLFKESHNTLRHHKYRIMDLEDKGKKSAKLDKYKECVEKVDKGCKEQKEEFQKLIKEKDPSGNLFE